MIPSPISVSSSAPDGDTEPTATCERDGHETASGGTWGSLSPEAALVITVRGIPKPKGSLRHVGRGRLIEQVNNAPWMDSIIWASAAAMPTPDPIGGPLTVHAAFTFPKPASAPKGRRTWPTTRTSGDLDKHCRLLLDALQAAGAIVDDAQVIELYAVKRFVGEGMFALPHPGVHVRVYTITDPSAPTSTTGR